MTTDQKITKLQSLLKMMDESLTKEDFVLAFEKVLAYVKATDFKVEQELVDFRNAVAKLSDQVKNESRGEVDALKEQVRAEMERTLAKVEADCNQMMLNTEATLSAVKDGEDADEGAVIEAVLARMPPPPVIPPPQSGEDFRNALEALHGEDRLDKSAIKGIEDLEKAISEGKSVSIGGGTRGMFLYIDGVKKGLINNLNLVPGTNMAIAYSKVNGQDTLTFNATGGGPGGITVETPTGLVNGSNTVFTVSAEPQWVVADGTTYFDGKGYTYAALSITMDIPPSASIRVII